MQLTGRQILEKEIIQGSLPDKSIQQQGIDLTIDKIFDCIMDTPGKVGKDNSSNQLPEFDWEIDPTKKDGGQWFLLHPGYYEVYFEQGCQIPDNIAVQLKTRSTLVRSGATIHSGQFDAGFYTDKMGAFMEVRRYTAIEKGARVCQLLAFETDTVPFQDLYDGQYQGKSK